MGSRLSVGGRSCLRAAVPWILLVLGPEAMALADDGSAAHKAAILQMSEATCRRTILENEGGLDLANLAQQVAADCVALGMSDRGLRCLRLQWSSVALLGYGSDDAELPILRAALGSQDVTVRTRAVLALIARRRYEEAIEPGAEILSTALNYVHLGLVIAGFDDRGVRYVLRAASQGMANDFAGPVADLLRRVRNESQWVPFARRAVEGQILRWPSSVASVDWLGVLLDGVDAEWAEARLQLMASASENETVRQRARGLLASRREGRGQP